MESLKVVLFLALVLLSNAAYSQKPDLAQIISGSYKCEITSAEYGKGEYQKTKGTVSISKIGENKIKISYGSDSYTISTLTSDGNTTIMGEEPSPDNNGDKGVHLSLYESPAVISGRSSNGTSEKEPKSWSFEGISTDTNKPRSLSSEPASREIYVKPMAEFGGKIMKKRDVALCILGKVGTPVNTLSVKKAADEQQISGVLVLDIPFPEDAAWKSNSYEAQTKRYWEETNKPFLANAVAQNAEIRWIVDPRLDKYKYSEKPKGAKFDTVKDGANISKVLSYTNFEYQYLLSKGYKLDATTGIMSK
ncbi:hypothetical protein GCM10022409_42560 [Hymenobacter glaciei]|uniref:Uncharacterized protein n=1 Tax=Hymenobacter glaciei TaxID=877209 RepID=A0ABP7US54_9BACT